MRKIFKLDVFPAHFEFWVGEEELDKYRRVNKHPPLKENDLIPDGLTIGSSIWIKDKNVLCTVVHEIYHATCFICETLGIEDEETTAYLIQYMFQCYIDWIFPG